MSHNDDNASVSSHLSTHSRVSHSAEDAISEDLPFLPPSLQKPTQALPNTSYQVQDDESLSFFYKPHSISMLLAAIAVMLYLALNTDSLSQDEAAKLGLLAVTIAFLFFSMLQMRDGPFTRPHPAFWRVVLGSSVIYLLALVFLFFQTHSQAMKIIQWWIPEYGIPLKDRSYATDCRLYTPEDPEGSFVNIVVRDTFEVV
eukprot:TRINITY_DN10461_c0_g1_i2.p1 TRINITY_DN10461_c0_g1~~TRINITY_DN10461_c0_g1_i2.p1  ORF type:complete len:200 (+),score=33.68 TRINITY_DN10461_c0_g1_i2:123-722(+)